MIVCAIPCLIEASKLIKSNKIAEKVPLPFTVNFHLISGTTSFNFETISYSGYCTILL